VTKFAWDTVDDTLVTGMYFALPQGDLSFALYKIDNDHAKLDVHTPATMSDLIAKSLRSWLRGIKTDVSPVFAGRVVPMVTIHVDLPGDQVGHVIEVIVRLAGLAFQKAGGG
jgi:hypothetical protein